MPFAAICGRICFHPCETACKRGQIDQPLSICATKRFLGDEELRQGIYRHPPQKEARPEKVAVVGAGPAGLSAAYYLALEGYPVTIFEKLPVVGGMLAVGIPDYRLPRNIIKAEVKNLESLGVAIRTGVSFGSDVTYQSLQQEGYKAFFLATGLHKSTGLRVSGEELKGSSAGSISYAGFLWVKPWLSARRSSSWAAATWPSTAPAPAFAWEPMRSPFFTAARGQKCRRRPGKSRKPSTRGSNFSI
jgi:hypothetical protein